MKRLFRLISWWLVLPFFSVLVLIGCKSREKTVSKVETESERKVESTAKIEEKTFEITNEKIFQESIKTIFVVNSEQKKDETKDVQIIREYYENGNLKSEIQKVLSKINEENKQSTEETKESLKLEIEKSAKLEREISEQRKYIKKQKESIKSKDMMLKSNDSARTYFVILGFILGFIFGIVSRDLLKVLKSLLMRFVPYLKLIEWLKK